MVICGNNAITCHILRQILPIISCTLAGVSWVSSTRNRWPTSSTAPSCRARNLSAVRFLTEVTTSKASKTRTRAGIRPVEMNECIGECKSFVWIRSRVTNSLWFSRGFIRTVVLQRNWTSLTTISQNRQEGRALSSPTIIQSLWRSTSWPTRPSRGTSLEATTSLPVCRLLSYCLSYCFLEVLK